jgi:hypothetical protein
MNKKMKKVKKMSAAVILAAASIYSCHPGQDLTVPQVDSILVNALEQEEHEVSAGTNVDLVIQLSDNENLKQVKLNVHAADDGHGHGGTTGQVYEPNVGSWSYSKIIDISGTVADVTTSLSIPNDIKGHWHIEVMAIDASGNEAEEAFTTLHVENAGLPAGVFVWNPAISSTDQWVHVPASAPQFTFSAEITDGDGLESIYWSVYSEDGILVDAQMIDGAGLLNMTTGDIQVTLPGAGLYDWTFRATDQNGYYNEWVQEVKVE